MKPVAIIQNCQVESAGNIREYLELNSIPFTETHSYRNQKLPDLSGVSAVINLGCPLSVTKYKEHEFLTRLFEFTKQAIEQEKPYLGVCFGAQMLALALGAKVSVNRKKEIGAGEIRLTKSGLKDPVFKGFDKSFPVFQWHGDTFEIPPGATNLAESDDCTNQAFRSGRPGAPPLVSSSRLVGAVGSDRIGRAVAIQFHFEADADKIPLWCDTYAEELAGEGIDKDEVIASYSAHADQMRTLSFKLLDNFFSLN